MATDVTLRIKNLSISLEALSRINAGSSRSLYDAIETILHGEVYELQKEQKRRLEIQSAPPARTSTAYDDIPF